MGNIVYNTIKDLKLNITYFSDGNIKSEELYHASPITLQPIKPTVFENEYYGFIIKQIGNNFFELYDADDELIGKYQFNRIIEICFCVRAFIFEIRSFY